MKLSTAHKIFLDQLSTITTDDYLFAFNLLDYKSIFLSIANINANTANGQDEAIQAFLTTQIQIAYQNEFDNQNLGQDFRTELEAFSFLAKVLLNSECHVNFDAYSKDASRSFRKAPIRTSVGGWIVKFNNDYHSISVVPEQQHQRTSIVRYLNTAIEMPRNWQDILSSILSRQITFSGAAILGVYQPNKGLELAQPLIRESLYLSNLDTSFFLALKGSIKRNEFLIKENGIALNLRNKTAAIISFRKKGKYVAMIQKESIEIFVKFKDMPRAKRERTVNHIISSSSGYYGIRYNYMETPVGYYIFTNEFVIDIGFIASAAL